VCDATAHVPTAPTLLLLPTVSATPYILRVSDPSGTSSLALPLPAGFWPSGGFLLPRQTILLFFRRLQYQPFLDNFNLFGLNCERLPSQHSHFSLAIYFCFVPTVLSRYSLLWERIVFCFRVVSSFVCINLILDSDDGPLLIIFCFYVISSSACIQLVIFLPHLDLFRVLWPCQFLEGDTEN